LPDLLLSNKSLNRKYPSDFLQCPSEAVLLRVPERLLGRAKRDLESMGLGGRIAAIHPGSGSAAKNWPLAKFLRLAEYIEGKMGCAVLFVAGEADASIVEEMRNSDCRFPILANLSLLEAAAKLSCCSFYAGNDSGVTHLAVAIGLPAIVLFGPTDPSVWAPRGCSVFVVSAPGGRGRVDGIKMRDVAIAMEKLKRSCYLTSRQ
jgi:ADP-heptose:LPS heptosyltransferase